MRRQLLTGLLMTVVLTVILGVLYPLVVTGISQVAFNDKADGSLIRRDGKVVGSSLLGQNFTEPEYFHPRPSAAGDGYDGLSSSASNLGPSSEKLLEEVEQRVVDYRETNGLAATVEVPVDAVTASGSGLDPHISIANAGMQAPRVADARGMDVDEVLVLTDEHTTERALGILGEKVVNVLRLNLALDQER